MSEPLDLEEIEAWVIERARLGLRRYSHDDVPALIAEVRRLREDVAFRIDTAFRYEKERDALQRFKSYVHQRLDEAGVPTHPDGPHSKEGCRVGDRLDIVLNAGWGNNRVKGLEEDRARLYDTRVDLAAALVEVTRLQGLVAGTEAAGLKSMEHVVRERDALSARVKELEGECAHHEADLGECNAATFAALARVKELEEVIEDVRRRELFWQGKTDELAARVKELEAGRDAEIARLTQVITDRQNAPDLTYQRLKEALTWVKELEGEVSIIIHSLNGAIDQRNTALDREAKLREALESLVRGIPNFSQCESGACGDCSICDARAALQKDGGK